MANRLIQEKSPYLQQHAHNPVDWFAWGEAAFEEARLKGKPIFLSVGYSTCHWCHVMERESFESPEVAEVLNREFVSIKVDREERPDVDRLYMTYVQAVTGSGGWPMSVFLTPELKPFYGGTYFPPVSTQGRPGFVQLLLALAHSWKNDRSNVEDAAERSAAGLRSVAAQGLAGGEEDEENGEFSSVAGPLVSGQLDQWPELYGACYREIAASFDEEWGGFGGPPKFPRPVVHDFLHAYAALLGEPEAQRMSAYTLRNIADRGMQDQLGGGFHRYSVDRSWVVPHFEKMLYDQAQLALAYVEMFQLSGESNWAQIAERTLRYVWRDMTHVEGAFFAAEDADSALAATPGYKEEGAFYVWTKAEIEQLLGQPDATLFGDFYGVESGGNAPREGDPHGEFRGKNILFEAAPLNQVARQNGLHVREAMEKLEAARLTLLEARQLRPRPHRDEKIIVAWNGLMISAFARGGAALDSHRFTRIAATAGEWLWREMWNGGTLLRHAQEGPAPVAGFADDYAALARGFLDLYEATFQFKWLERAGTLLDALHRDFWDEEGHGYFNAREDPHLLARFKEDYDGAEPSANSLAAWAWAKLGHLTGRVDALERATALCQALAPRIAAIPQSMPLLLRAHMMATCPPQHLVICGEVDGEDTRALLAVAREQFLPLLNVVVLGAEGQDVLGKNQPFLLEMAPSGGRATAYLCQNMTCQRPVTEPGELRELLRGRDKAAGNGGA